MTTTKKCIYCGHDFEPPKATTLMCAGCWFSGAHFEAQRKEFIAQLRAVPGVKEATFDHTGGNCWGLGIRLDDGRYLFATNGDLSLPEPGESWSVGTYANDEAGFYESDGPQPFRENLTDDQLVEHVRSEAAPPAPGTVAANVSLPWRMVLPREVLALPITSHCGDACLTVICHANALLAILDPAARPDDVRRVVAKHCEVVLFG